MAAISACTSTSAVRFAGFTHKPSAHTLPSTVLGLPAIVNVGKVSCSMKSKSNVVASEPRFAMGASMFGAAWAAAMSSPAAIALVDERMSTEGTGLPFGLSNNLLGWIIFGVFGLIWATYFSYTSTLDEEEDSGLSL